MACSIDYEIPSVKRLREDLRFHPTVVQALDDAWEHSLIDQAGMSRRVYVQLHGHISRVLLGPEFRVEEEVTCAGEDWTQEVLNGRIIDNMLHKEVTIYPAMLEAVTLACTTPSHELNNHTLSLLDRASAPACSSLPTYGQTVSTHWRTPPSYATRCAPTQITSSLKSPPHHTQSSTTLNQPRNTGWAHRKYTAQGFLLREE